MVQNNLRFGAKPLRSGAEQPGAKQLWSKTTAGNQRFNIFLTPFIVKRRIEKPLTKLLLTQKVM